jgi:tetratricopeptide (TPR) repeat protein
MQGHAAFSKKLSTSPLPPEVFAQVTSAWAEQDYGLGEQILAKALRQHPDHWHLRTCHAAAIAYCSKFRSARQAFDSLLHDTPREKKAHMLGLLGVEWCRIGRHDLALPLLRQALTYPSPPAPVWEACASALDHLGRHPESLEIIQQGLHRFPQHPGIMLIQATVERQHYDAAQAAHTAQRILRHPQASPDAKSRAAHELGHCLDSLGQYEKAFHAFQDAKRYRSADWEKFLIPWQQHQQHIAQAPLPAPSQWIQWQEQCRALPPLRVAMLVGCPRSGTTLLERILDAHPGIISASETVIFSVLWSQYLRSLPQPASTTHALQQMPLQDWQRLRLQDTSDMEDALEQPISQWLLLDKNPSHLTRLPSILRVFPESKVLMALRDPRAIAWSCFTQYLPANAESAAFAQLDTTARHVRTQWEFWHRLREQLPPTMWHESRYEKTVQEFSETTRQTLEFLEQPWSPQLEEYHRNKEPVRSPTYAEARRPIFTQSLEKWRHYEPFAEKSFASLRILAEK